MIRLFAALIVVLLVVALVYAAMYAYRTVRLERQRRRYAFYADAFRVEYGYWPTVEELNEWLNPPVVDGLEW